jgi:hypothetical protein
MMQGTPWLLLLYKIPRQPSALRVSIWRKMKQTGALLIHDSAWALPENERTLEHFRWLCEEIVEMGGEARMFRCEPVGQDDLAEKMLEQVEREFRQILSELRGKAASLESLSKRYQQASARNYLHSPLQQKVRRALERRMAR